MVINVNSADESLVWLVGFEACWIMCGSNVCVDSGCAPAWRGGGEAEKRQQQQQMEDRRRKG